MATIFVVVGVLGYSWRVFNRWENLMDGDEHSTVMFFFAGFAKILWTYLAYLAVSVLLMQFGSVDQVRRGFLSDPFYVIAEMQQVAADRTQQGLAEAGISSETRPRPVAPPKLSKWWYYYAAFIVSSAFWLLDALFYPLKRVGILDILAVIARWWSRIGNN